MEHKYRNPYGVCSNAWDDRGERIDLPNGCHAIVKAMMDDTLGAPWDEHDGHVVGIREAKRNYTGNLAKTPGERVLYDGTGRYAAVGRPMVYDFQESVKVAIRDGWGCDNSDGLTKKQIAVKAVEEDAELMRKWCASDWGWMGVEVTLYDKDDSELASDSLWGIEGYGDYWKEVATEMIEVLYEAEMKSRHDAWRAALKEARERHYWNQRDVVTA
jgi:hypothetical protein